MTIQITIFFHFVPVNEAHNFTQGEAKVSRFLAKFLNYFTCGIWTIKVPPGTEIICDMQRNAFRSKTRKRKLRWSYVNMSESMIKSVR